VKTVKSELVKYELGLVAMQEIILDNGSSQPVNEYTVFCG
jgi:hypothetical protein